MGKMLALLLFLSGPPALASLAKSLQFDLHDSKVDFLSIGHPSAIKIRGEGSKLAGKMTIEDRVATGLLIFDLDSLDTNIGMRNKHMKEKYLETAKFKNAELEFENLNIPEQIFSAGTKSVAVPFSGVLSLHGTKHPVQGTSQIRLENNKMSGTADFEIKLSDYKIQIPAYLGITVADVVKVTVNFSADGNESKE